VCVCVCFTDLLSGRPRRRVGTLRQRRQLPNERGNERRASRHAPRVALGIRHVRRLRPGNEPAAGLEEVSREPLALRIRNRTAMFAWAIDQVKSVSECVWLVDQRAKTDPRHNQTRFGKQ
jgi:hypothetical protein